MESIEAEFLRRVKECVRQSGAGVNPHFVLAELARVVEDYERALRPAVEPSEPEPAPEV